MLSHDLQIISTVRTTQRSVENDSTFGFFNPVIGNGHNTLTAFTFEFEVFASNFCNEMAAFTTSLIRNVFLIYFHSNFPKTIG